jgi:hypothetical protein
MSSLVPFTFVLLPRGGHSVASLASSSGVRLVRASLDRKATVDQWFRCMASGKKEDGKDKEASKDSKAKAKWAKQRPREILHPEATLTVPRLTTSKDARRFLKWLQPDEQRLLAEALNQANAKGANDPMTQAVNDGPAKGEESLADSANGAAADGADEVAPPSRAALTHLAIHQSLPFVGFGFLDNLIMIVAGEYIDHNIGVSLGISTMAAAALGNAISDVFGVGSAWYVERFCARLGVPGPPPLTLDQLELPSARMAANLGR